MTDIWGKFTVYWTSKFKILNFIPEHSNTECITWEILHIPPTAKIHILYRYIYILLITIKLYLLY